MNTSLSSRIISGFWVGNELPPIAALSIKSFLDHGFNFQLFTYQEYKNIPEGTLIRDARDILPEKEVFIHNNGSYSVLGDLFRYTALELEGGWWSDLDVICLTDELPSDEIWFANQEPGVWSVGIIRFPAHHILINELKRLSEDPSNLMPWDNDITRSEKCQFQLDSPDINYRRKHAAWGYSGPHAFSAAVQFFNLECYGHSSDSVYPLNYTVWRHYYNGCYQLSHPIFQKTWAIHVWGEMLRREPDAIDNISPDSIIAQLMQKHGIETSPSPMSNNLPEPQKILVGICSCVSARNRRDAVRKAWSRYPHQNVKCLFFMGGNPSNHIDEQEDTIILDVPDGYNDLPAKVFCFFKYALENYDFDWIFKCDDDTYLDISRLPEIAVDGYDLIGDMLVEHRNAPSGGAGYLLSRDIVKKILSQPNLPSTGAEDVIVGDLVSKLGGKSMASGRLYMNNVYYPTPDNDMVSSHWCSPDILEAIHTFNHSTPDAIYEAKHIYWADDILFFSNGTFRRKSSSCYGRWELRNNYELSLLWQMWPCEQLILEDDIYIGSEMKIVKKQGSRRLQEISENKKYLSEPLPDENIYIHLGCKERRIENWLNLDYPNYDIKKILPWKDNKVDAYFIEHTIESLDSFECYQFFKEAKRTLKPGGILRICFTDIVKLHSCKNPAIHQYFKNKFPQKIGINGILSISMEECEFRSTWSKESISLLLEDLGFIVTEHNTSCSSHSHLQNLEQTDYDYFSLERIGSVCIEAQIPSKSKNSEEQSDNLYVTPLLLSGNRTGNRLFQIAAVYAHALRHGLRCHIPWKHSSEISDIFDYLAEDAAPCPNGGYHEKVTYKEPHFSYSPIPADVSQGALDGYFQSEKYFMDAEPQVRALFRKLTAPKQCGVAGVHVRMGDYLVRTDMYHSPNEEFLTESLNRLSKHIRELVVFSDMPQEALQLIKSLPASERFTIRVDDHNTLGSLRELSSMEELILSCSSFSWWGAYLGDQDKVFVQSPWFSGSICDDQDVYRKKWTKIKLSPIIK